MTTPCVSETNDDTDSDDDFELYDTYIANKDEYLSRGLGPWASDFDIPHAALVMLLDILPALHPHLSKISQNTVWNCQAVPGTLHF